MLQWFKRRTETRHKAEKIYGGVVAAARRHDFYSRLGVPDTPEGRFELVALHLFLVLEPLRAQGPETADLTQRTIETFVTDMDDCMREMGVGDLTVPKKVKKAAAAFYERAGQYREALKVPSDALLERIIDTYLFKGKAPESARGTMTTYVRGVVSGMSGLSVGALADDSVLREIMDQNWDAAA